MLRGHAARSGGTRLALGPRVTFNLSPETALVFVADARTTTRGSNTDASLYAFELRRAIDAGDRVTMSWMLGGGVSRRRDVEYGYTHQGITHPDRVRTQNNGAVTLGIGFDERVAGHLVLRQDFRMVFAGEGSEVRAQFGIGLPIGRYPLGQVRQSRVFGEETIRSGHRVWVTDASGREVSGRVGSIDDDSVEVVTRTGRTSIRLNDIERLERPDGLGNGAKLGAQIGAGTMAGLMALMAVSFGGVGDVSGAMAIGLVSAVGAGYGAGLGALFGAVVDSLLPGRRTVFEHRANAKAVTAAPFISANARGAGAVVSW